jgi:hypothetical protein
LVPAVTSDMKPSEMSSLIDIIDNFCGNAQAPVFKMLK